MLNSKIIEKNKEIELAKAIKAARLQEIADAPAKKAAAEKAEYEKRVADYQAYLGRHRSLDDFKEKGKKKGFTFQHIHDRDNSY